MSKSHEIALLPHATLRGILDQSIEHGHTTRKAIGIAAEADDEMVRRWLNGQLPKLRKFKLLISVASLLPDALKDALMDWFCRGTPYRAVRVGESDRTVLDPTGDRIVDARDTLVFQVQAVCAGGEAMTALTTALTDGRLDEAERAQVRALLYEHRDRVQRAIDTVECNGQRLRVAE